MFGVPEQIELLSREVTYAEASALIRSLPLEIAAPLRDLVVPTAVATSALLSAHMIIFWLSQDSNVTPPVALAAFTAAAIAKAPAMATGVASWKLAKGLYIIPVLFAYTPFLSGNWPAMIQVFLFGAVGVYALAGALQGCLEKPIGWIMRALCFAAGLAALWPDALIVNIAGAVATVGLLVVNIRFGKTPPMTIVAASA